MLLLFNIKCHSFLILPRKKSKGVRSGDFANLRDRGIILLEHHLPNTGFNLDFIQILSYYTQISYFKQLEDFKRVSQK